MHKLYQKTQKKIGRLKAAAVQSFCREKERGSTNVADHSCFFLNLKIVGLEFIFDLLKLLIILTHDSGTVFKIFYQTNAFDACRFSYRSFKGVHKKVRVFSYAIILAIASATSFIILKR